MMAILAVNRDLIFKVGDLGCSAAFSSIVVLPAANSNIYLLLFNTVLFPAQRITVQVISAASQKYCLKYFHRFLSVLIFVIAILSVNRRVYVSDGDFDC